MAFRGREMMALLLISGLLHSASAGVTYTVGGTFGWGIPLDQNQTFYDDQFKNTLLSVGDELLFPFTFGFHDVYEVSQADASNCDSSNALLKNTATNSTVKLTTSGTHAFICAVDSHCSRGMHLTVTVLATNGTGTEGPSSSLEGHSGAATNLHSGFAPTFVALTAACAALLL